MKIIMNLCFAAVFAFAFYSFLKAGVPQKPASMDLAVETHRTDSIQVADLNKKS